MPVTTEPLLIIPWEHDTCNYQRIRPVEHQFSGDKKFIRQISVFFKIGEEFEGLRILTNITLKTAIVLILPFYRDIIGSY